MKNTIRISLVFVIFLFGENGMELSAQNVSRISKSDSLSEIRGKITDKETGEEMIAANIIITKNGNFIQGETTDIDGNYTIQVDSGNYDMEVSYTGCRTQKITGIPVIKGQATKVDVQLSTNLKLQILNIVVMNICIPLIQQDETSTGQKIDEYEIKRQATRNINNIITITPGVSFTQ